MEGVINMLIASIGLARRENAHARMVSQGIMSSVMILMNVCFQMEAAVTTPRALILWVRKILTYYMGYDVFTGTNEKFRIVKINFWLQREAASTMPLALKLCKGS